MLTVTLYVYSQPHPITYSSCSSSHWEAALLCHESNKVFIYWVLGQIYVRLYFSFLFNVCICPQIFHHDIFILVQMYFRCSYNFFLTCAFNFSFSNYLLLFSLSLISNCLHHDQRTQFLPCQSLKNHCYFPYKLLLNYVPYLIKKSIFFSLNIHMCI